MNVETVAVDRSSSSAVPLAPLLPMDLIDQGDTNLVRVRPPELSVRQGARAAITDVENAFCVAVAAQAEKLEAGFLGRALADLALDYDWDGAPNRRFPALEALKCFVAEFVTKVPGLEGNAERGAHQAQGGVCADLGCGHDDRVGGDATEQRVGSPHPLLRLQLHRRPPALRGAQLSVVVERGVPGDGRG